MQIPRERLVPVLRRVQKPARYVGQEWNGVTKDWAEVQVSLALCYPDLYEIGMSNLGLGILYDIVNAQSNMVAERVYAPWPDMEAAMREAGLPLYSLETHRSLDEFDVLGFSMQHELNYTNVLNMLDLAGLPVLAAERTDHMPLVIAGGSCTYNPEPMADFIEAFVIGEGEEVILELLAAVSDGKRRGVKRRALLNSLAHIPGVYVPNLYSPRYSEDGRFLGMSRSSEEIPERIRKRIVSRLGPVPSRPLLPTMPAVHDRAMIEIQRGCGRGCRFCQAGIIYRPVRERPVDETLQAVEEVLANTGHSEVSFVSLSSSDHSGIEEIIKGALALAGEEPLSISLPSLRTDSFSIKLAQAIQTTRKTSLTFAPEAGSQRLRDVINKGVAEEDLLRTAAAAFDCGWNRVKLYFMIGLPTETDQDVQEIVRLARATLDQGRRLIGRRAEVSVSVSTFVPKPHTPFQWAPLADRETVRRRQEILRQGIRGKGLRLSWSEWDATWLEAILSRGDRRLGPVIRRAWRSGARFDAWHEYYNPEIWREALAAADLDDEQFLRARAAEEALPWEVLDVGVTRRFLWREHQRALEGILTPDCRNACHGCGILELVPEGERASITTWACP